MSEQYEFNEMENRTIAKVGLWAMVLGIVYFVDGALSLFPDFNVVAAGISVTVGVFYLLGGRAFRAVVNTEGRDVTFMLSALSKVGIAFLVRTILMLVVGGILVTVGIVVGLVAAAS